MWGPHERPGALHDAGDRSDVQAAGVKEEYIKKGSPPPEVRLLDSNTTSSLLQYCKSNLSTASTTSSLPLYNQCKSTSNHISNNYTKHPEIMCGVRIRARFENSYPCCDWDDYYSIRLTTGTGSWRRNRVLRSYEEEEYYLGRNLWRTPAPPRRRVRFAHYY